MKGGDISNVSSPQLIVLSEVVCPLVESVTSKMFSKKVERSLGELNVLPINRLWHMGTDYGVSLELAAFSTDGWTSLLLEKLMERMERRVANPFNYFELYENIEEFIGMIPYRPNLRGVVDVSGRVARYGSAGIELQNL